MLQKLAITLLATIPLYALDTLPPATTPPQGLEPHQVPQFIILGSDDNGQEDGLTWLTELLENTTNPVRDKAQEETFDGTPANASFYVAGNVLGKDTLITLFQRLYEQGFDISNHTYSHKGAVEIDWEKSVTSLRRSIEEYTEEIERCNNLLVSKVGMAPEDIKGFRAPYAAYSDTALTAVENLGMLYDCSIFSGNESWEDVGDVGEYFWPYTLENGSHSTEKNWYNTALDLPIRSHPGLWEMPIYLFQAPTDEECEYYGAEVGLRDKINSAVTWEAGGKVDGIDYNLWYTYKLNKEDCLAILKYTLDKMYKGNRSPMHYVIHSDFYSDATLYKNSFPSIPDYLDRRAILEEFLAYATTLPDVRIVSSVDVIEWMRNPVPLSGATPLLRTQKAQKEFTITSNNSTLSITIPQSGSYAVTIMDLQGRVIREIYQQLQAGENSITLSQQELASQLYIISLKNNKGIETIQRVILN